MSTPPLPSFHLELAPDLPPRGSLSDVPAYVVLLWAAQRRFTGRISFERENRVKRMDLENGGVVRIRSNLVPETLSAFMEAVLGIPSLKVTQLQTRIAVKERGRFDEATLLARAVDEGLCSREDAKRLKEIQFEEIFLNLAGWFDGAYDVEPGKTYRGEETAGIRPLDRLLTELEALLMHRPTPFELGKFDGLDLAGDLRRTGGAALVHFLSSRRANGELFLQREDRRKRCVFDRGRIVSVSSTNAAETLPVILRRWNFLSAERVAEIETAARGESAGVREILRARAALSEEQIASAMATLHAERVLEIFSWRSGRYRFRGNVTDRPAAPESENSVDRALGELDSRAGPSEPFETVWFTGGENPAVRALAQRLCSLWTSQGKSAVLVLPSSEPEAEGLRLKFRRILWLSDSAAAFPWNRTEIAQVVLTVEKGRTPRRRIEKELNCVPEALRRSARFVYLDSPDSRKFRFRWRRPA